MTTREPDFLDVLFTFVLIPRISRVDRVGGLNGHATAREIGAQITNPRRLVRIPEIFRRGKGVSSPSRLLEAFLSILIVIICLVAGTGVLRMVFAVMPFVKHCVVWFGLRNKVLTEFGTPLVD